ncbi:hypothetical protein [Lysobacter xanthus]
MRDNDDLHAIDALVTRFYASFDNTAAPPRQTDIVSCFADDARIVRSMPGLVESYSVDEFVAPRLALLDGGGLVGFSEQETSAQTQVFGGIAARTSRYAKSGVLHGRPYAGSGLKLFQLIRVASGWRISALAWTDDDG